MSQTNSIPANQVVNVIPSVLGAGGTALDIIGLMLTESARPPLGQILSFPDQPTVADYFGSLSDEAVFASKYFLGYNGKTITPAALLVAQYNSEAVGAYLRSGDISGLSLAQLQALNGTLILTVDGSEQTGSVNFSGALSFSAAAALIETALNTATAATGSVAANVVTGSIAVNVGTGSIAGTTMTISANTTGRYAPGQTVSGTGVAAGTTIVEQLTGTAGATGTYQVSISQTVASTTLTATGGTLTVSAVTSGTLFVGQVISGSGITSGTTITAFLTGTGGTGTYAVDVAQTASSTTVTGSGGTLTISAVSAGTFGVGDVFTGTNVTAGNEITAFLTGTGTTGTYLCSIGDTAASTAISVTGADVDVSYDSTAGAFNIASGTTGDNSTITYATGTLSASLLLTQATGAVISQGGAATSPATFMDGVVDVTQNWVTFSTVFDPDASGHANKLAFAAWTNDQDQDYAYVPWDTDVSPTTTVPATSSLGYDIAQADYSGTFPVYAPDYTIAAMVMGTAASINFNRTNGRITFKFRKQDGLEPSVTNALVATNLAANGYNFYGGYATRNQDFTFLANGVVSGQFAWFDSYINQIQLNNQLQLAILTGLTNVGSIPYNSKGYSLIEAFCMDPINQALNFGSIRPGVTLSAAQITAVNEAAGAIIAPTLQTRGWYLQVKDASPQVRAARGSPPCTLWYMDGGSIQKIDLASIMLQ